MDASPHVLVVDDHRDIREPLARYLERHGLRVTAAENFARPSWEVSRAERRCDSEAVTREWLRRILR